MDFGSLLRLTVLFFEMLHAGIVYWHLFHDTKNQTSKVLILIVF